MKAITRLVVTATKNDFLKYVGKYRGCKIYSFPQKKGGLGYIAEDRKGELKFGGRSVEEIKVDIGIFYPK